LKHKQCKLWTLAHHIVVMACDEAVSGS
jgi:hypothetical protein